MTEDLTATILVVGGERERTDRYASWLEPRHAVRTAYGGRAALDAVDESVDLLLLDRPLPGYSGTEVLSRIRDRGLECRAVVLTGDDPEADGINPEADGVDGKTGSVDGKTGNVDGQTGSVDEPAFDDSLTRPVGRTALLETVEAMTVRDAYHETLREYFVLASRKAALEVEKTPTELRNSDRYHTLTVNVRAVEAEAESVAAGFETDFEALFRDFQAVTEDAGSVPGGLQDLPGS